MSTVGRVTPANSAICFFGRRSSCHSTIRALVATVAGTSRLFSIACSSDRSAASTHPVNNTDSQANVS